MNFKNLASLIEWYKDVPQIDETEVVIECHVEGVVTTLDATAAEFVSFIGDDGKPYSQLRIVAYSE